LTYSPQQILPKEPQEKGETTLPDDPFARKSTVQPKLAAPQFDFDDDDDLFGSLDDEGDDPFLQGTQDDLFAPKDDVFTTPTPTPTLAPTKNGLLNGIFAMEAENGEEIIPSMILAGSIAGFVVAINDSTGDLLWKFVATDPIIQRVIIVKNHVYACSLSGGMYCLDARNGEEIWFSKGITQFIAESKGFVYALNSRREIAILDRNTGHVQATLPAMPFDFFLDNCETDRIYAGTNKGLLQCLREIHLPDPVKHRPNRIDLAEQLQIAIEEALEQKMQRRPGSLMPQQPASTSVPSFGSGYESFDNSPFGGADDDFINFSSDDDDFDSPF